MYAPTIILLMVIGPLLCITLELQQGGTAVLTTVILKWFAFWTVGLRLLLAGMRPLAVVEAVALLAEAAASGPWLALVQSSQHLPVMTMELSSHRLRVPQRLDC